MSLKARMLRHVINMDQLCGIKEYTLENGPSEGVKVAEVRTGLGLTFSVLKNRGLDIADMYYNGLPLHFSTFGGITPPSEAYARGNEFLRAFFGGMLCTCGITYTGRPNVDQGEELGLHGRYSLQSAKVSTVRTEWEQDDYVIEIGGEVREAALFGPNASLKRTIQTAYNSNTITINDVFTNHHNIPTPHAILYHFTFGYPLVEEGAELVYHAKAVTSLEDSVRDHTKENMKVVPAPIAEHKGAAQDFLYIDVAENSEGFAQVGLINRKRGIGIKLEYPKAQLPRLGNWLHFGEGEYLTAFEPMNSGVEGRARDRELGWIETIPAGGTKTYTLKFTVLTTQEELDQLAASANG